MKLQVLLVIHIPDADSVSAFHFHAIHFVVGENSQAVEVQPVLCAIGTANGNGDPEAGVIIFETLVQDIPEGVQLAEDRVSVLIGEEYGEFISANPADKFFVTEGGLCGRLQVRQGAGRGEDGGADAGVPSAADEEDPARARRTRKPRPVGAAASRGRAGRRGRLHRRPA